MAPADAYMRDSDAFSWYMEADPLLRSTIVSVVVLDSAPELVRLSDRIERATRISPGFRHRVVQAPWRIANPRWAVDPDFNLEFHARHIGVPLPGTLAQVFEYACQTGMAGFDRDRPLWEFTLVDGLEGGRAALILKLHHTLTDGIGGMEMAKYLFDLEPEPSTLGPMPDAPEPELLSSIDLARDAVCHNLSRIAHLPRNLLEANPYRLLRAALHPATAVKTSLELIRSVARTVRPVRSTLSPIMTDRRLAWHYDAFTVALESLRDAARVSHLTLNDVFLGAISGGLLRYHERQGFSVDELRLTMPISIRTADDPIGGNRITLMRFKVPTGLHDPLERMRRIHQLGLSARHEAAIPYTNAIAAALNVLPHGVVGGMLKHVDFLASNVPGIDVPVYLAGAHVAEWYTFGPTIGSALNATLVSYDGSCFVGVNIDTGAIPDGNVMLECLRESFDEIIALGASDARA